MSTSPENTPKKGIVRETLRELFSMGFENLPPWQRAVWRVVWMGVFFFGAISMMATFFSLKNTVCYVPEAEGAYQNFMAFCINWLVPALAAPGIFLFLLGAKVYIARLSDYGAKMGLNLLLILGIVVMGSMSMVFDYDFFFSGSRLSYLVEQEQTKAYMTYQPILTDARAAAQQKMADLEDAAKQDIDTLQEQLRDDIQKLREESLGATTTVLTTGQSDVEDIRKERDEKIHAAEQERDEKIREIEQARDARMQVLEDAQASWIEKQERELARILADKENEEQGRQAVTRDGEQTSGVADRGPLTMEHESAYEIAKRDYDATKASRKQRMQTEEDRFSQQLEDTRQSYGQQITDLRDSYGIRITEAEQTAGDAVTAARGLVNTDLEDDIETLRDTFNAAKERREGTRDEAIDEYEVLVEDIGKAGAKLQELRLCDKLECVSDRESELGKLLIPIGTLTEVKIPSTVTLPPMFASLDIAVKCLVAPFSSSQDMPREWYMVIFCSFFALALDGFDAIFLLIMAYVSSQSAINRRKEENEVAEPSPGSPSPAVTQRIASASPPPPPSAN